MSASGRTGRVMPDQLLEQSPDWGWFTHGETGDALLRQNALNERDRLAGDDAIAYDLLNTRTRQQPPTTSNVILRDPRKQHRWTGQLEHHQGEPPAPQAGAQGLAMIEGASGPAGDMGGGRL